MKWGVLQLMKLLSAKIPLLFVMFKKYINIHSSSIMPKVGSLSYGFWMGVISFLRLFLGMGFVVIILSGVFFYFYI